MPVHDRTVPVHDRTVPVHERTVHEHERTVPIHALRAAQAVKGTGRAALEARNGTLKQVKSDMRNYLVFAQQSADADEEQAARIFASAGLQVKRFTPFDKPDLALFPGAASGSVRARARSRGRGATCWWAFSLDKATWVVAPATRIPQASIDGLAPGTLYYFRLQTLTKAGLSDWSQIVSFRAT